MKKIFTLILCLITIISYGQYSIPQSVGNSPNTIVNTNAINGKLITKVYTDTTIANTEPIKFYDGAIIKVGKVLYIRNTATNEWVVNGGSSGSSLSPRGPISTLPTVGFNPGVNISADSFINAAFYGLQPPLSTLTGGLVYEYTTGTTFNATLNWSASRQANTAALNTIVVGGIFQTFANPSAPGTVSGTQVVSVPVNTNVPYSNTVTALNGMSSTSTVQFIGKRKIFAGFVSTATPSDADIIAATGSVYVGGTLSDVKIQTGALSTPTSSNYIMFASPASFGVPTIVINGLTVTFNQITRSFVNINGYSSSYYIMVSPFPTSGGVAAYSIQ